MAIWTAVSHRYELRLNSSQNQLGETGGDVNLGLQALQDIRPLLDLHGTVNHLGDAPKCWQGSQETGAD